MFITDPWTIEQIKAQRAETGTDKHDEVWDGVYIVSPLANNEHQRLVSRLTTMFQAVVDNGRLGEAFAGVNVSDRIDDWKQNYREPDVAVFLEGTTARDMDTHWLGGPDFAIEILSPSDRGREKLDFYARVNVRELLVIDRDPWRLELYRITRRRLRSVGTSAPKEGEALPRRGSSPWSFRLVADRPRPTIEVVQHRWPGAGRRSERGLSGGPAEEHSDDEHARADGRRDRRRRERADRRDAEHRAEPGDRRGRQGGRTATREPVAIAETIRISPCRADAVARDEPS